MNKTVYARQKEKNGPQESLGAESNVLIDISSPYLDWIVNGNLGWDRWSSKLLMMDDHSGVDIRSYEGCQAVMGLFVKESRYFEIGWGNPVPDSQTVELVSKTAISVNGVFEAIWLPNWDQNSKMCVVRLESQTVGDITYVQDRAGNMTNLDPRVDSDVPHLWYDIVVSDGALDQTLGPYEYSWNSLLR